MKVITVFMKVTLNKFPDSTASFTNDDGSPVNPLQQSTPFGDTNTINDQMAALTGLLGMSSAHVKVTSRGTLSSLVGRYYSK